MMLCYNTGLGQDEKRQTADSFVVNKLSLSAQKWSNPLVNFKAVDWSVVRLQAIKIVMRHN